MNCATIFGGPLSLRKLTGPKDEDGYGLGGVALEIRRKAVADPLYFGSEVLGRDFFRNPCPEHVQAARAMVEQRNMLLLLPRGHCKTTLVDEIGTIWQWLAYPNDRILFLQASGDNAKALAKQVRQHLMQNEAFKALFPEYAMTKADEEGNILSFSVPCRTAITREASLEIGTPDTNLSGRHYDLICASDIVNEQNVPPAASYEQVEKLNEWYGTTRSLLDTTNPRSHRRIDGTRWHTDDLYGKILKGDFDPKVNPHNDPNIEKKKFVKIVNGIRTGEDGLPQPIWMHRPQASLIEDRASMSDYLWAANMVNDPMQLGRCMFRAEWFKPYDKAPEAMEIAITLDPAFTTQDKNPRADRSAIIVSGVDKDRHLYVLAIRAGRWSSRDLLDNMHSLIEVWKPDWVGIEESGQQRALIDMFLEDRLRYGKVVPFRPLKPYSTNKTVRALALQSIAQKDGVYVKLPEMQELVDEFVRFTGGPSTGMHDDLVDALVYRAQDLSGAFIEEIVKRTPLVQAPPSTRLLTGADFIATFDDPDCSEPVWWEVKET